MQVILLVNIPKLGKKNEIITVKPGYALNYLIPNKKAVITSEQNLKKQSEIESKEKLSNLLKIQHLNSISEKLKQTTLYFQVKFIKNQPEQFINHKKIINTLLIKHNIALPKTIKLNAKKFKIGHHKIQINLGENIISHFQLIIEAK